MTYMYSSLCYSLDTILFKRHNRAILFLKNLIGLIIFRIGFAGSVTRQLLKKIITKFTGEVETTPITNKKNSAALFTAESIESSIVQN
jgi:hypothetical protein